MAGTGTSSLEEFKARLPLAELVGRWVKLTRRGREHLGLCPFHQERTPSFHVVAEKGFYHCFGCGAHGGAIDFVMAVERLDFAAALTRVAELTGIEPPRQRHDPRKDARERLYAALAAAQGWYAAQLWAEAGGTARTYLVKRGVDKATAQEFGLGYAPASRGGLHQALLERGHAQSDLLEAGLIAASDQGDLYDRLRDRLLFPIADERGRVVGFGGRALGEARAKYLNSPDGDLFHKGDLLYRYGPAMAAARGAGDLVVAEGYMDVIALWRAGVRHAVAPLGTAVTERQLELLWRHGDAPLFCLDGDRAGIAAAMRVAERALPMMRDGRTLRFALLPEGEDPDSYIARSGAEAMLGVLERAMPLSALIWRLHTQGQDFSSPEARAGLARRLREFARKATDRDFRTALESGFAQLVADRFPFRGRRRDLSRSEAGPRDRLSGLGSTALHGRLPDPAWRREARLLAWLLRHPEWLRSCEDDVAALQLVDPALDRLRQDILVWYAEAENLDAALLINHLRRHGFADLSERVRSCVALGVRDRGEGTPPDFDDWRRSVVAYGRKRASPITP